MPGAHLVAWLEDSFPGPANRVVFATLSDDARPASEPYTLAVAADPFLPPHVASDGVSFLLVWGTVDAYMGAIITREGKVQGQPFAVPIEDYVSSVVWNGAAYVVTGTGPATLVATNGAILQPVPSEHEHCDSGPDGRFLARDGERMLALDFDAEFPPFGSTPVWVLYSTAVRRADLTSMSPDNAIDQAWAGRIFESGALTWPPKPAVAAGGGHRLVVWRKLEVSDSLSALEPIEIMGDSFTRIEQVPPLSTPHAIWNGSGFFVTVGSVLLRHAPAGELIERQSLGDRILESNVAIGSVPFVVMVREAGVPRLFIRPFGQ
jgi:hypothetical protein